MIESVVAVSQRMYCLSVPTPGNKVPKVTLLTVFAWFIFCTSDRTKVIAQARSARAIAFRDGYACRKNHANMVVS